MEKKACRQMYLNLYSIHPSIRISFYGNEMDGRDGAKLAVADATERREFPSIERRSQSRRK